MRYAEVSVNSPAAQRRTFSYAIPTGLDLKPGHAVWAPFGNRILQGVVVELTEYPGVEETREIAGLIDPVPLLSDARLSLARWLSDYYLSPLFEAVGLMLPPGFERRTVTRISVTGREQTSGPLTQRQRHVLHAAGQAGGTSLKELEKALGKRNAQTTVSQLVARGLVARDYELERTRVRPKELPYLELAVPPEEALQEAIRMRGHGAGRQAALLDFLAGRRGPVTLSKVTDHTGASRSTARTLARKGLISIRNVRVRRQPTTSHYPVPPEPLQLSFAQEEAFHAIHSALTEEQPPLARVFLLHGVTGSGKTEVYLRALAETVALGKQGIVLVPEIALTPQTIERFEARFPGRVAVLHSRLSLGEQYDEWHAIRQGEADVVIGPRSAVFAPVENLGIIIIDEEHEWTYKQQEQSPRYHARDAAIRLAELTDALVVMGSATPDVESFHHARRGDYHLLRLPERIGAGGVSPLPPVEVVDLRSELRAGNRSIFSRALSEAVRRVLANQEQAILFLNRRGASTHVQCRDCGHVISCRRCDIPLSYHLAEDTLLCHQCNRRVPQPRTCPECGSSRIRYLGLGTQRLERELAATFPHARLLRWDSDVTRGKHSHQDILDRFRSHQADILIGTQMVAKGLDLPQVTLVGVVNADTSLNLPDFRAGERTFQLLCQVAGRAGRGTIPGQVIVQTYTPEHYAVQAAAGHDYDLFYRTEIAYRRQLHYPPFTRLATLTCTHTNDLACQREAERMERLIFRERDSQGIADLSLAGPAPAYIHRLRGRFRWQLTLRGTGLSGFLARIPVPQRCTVNIDPLGL